MAATTETTDLTGEQRVDNDGNIWKVVQSQQTTVRAKCVHGDKIGEYDTVTRVDFLHGLLDPAILSFDTRPDCLADDNSE